MPSKTKIIRIGNSQGVRIPKALIEQASLGDEVELIVQDGQVIVRSLHRPRAGWDEAFTRMAATGEDELLIPDGLEQDWDEQEWEW